METKNGYMEDAPEEIYAYYNVLLDALLGLEEKLDKNVKRTVRFVDLLWHNLQ